MLDLEVFCFVLFSPGTATFEALITTEDTRDDVHSCGAFKVNIYSVGILL